MLDNIIHCCLSIVYFLSQYSTLPLLLGSGSDSEDMPPPSHDLVEVGHFQLPDEVVQVEKQPINRLPESDPTSTAINSNTIPTSQRHQDPPPSYQPLGSIALQMGSTVLLSVFLAVLVAVIVAKVVSRPPPPLPPSTSTSHTTPSHSVQVSTLIYMAGNPLVMQNFC